MESDYQIQIAAKAIISFTYSDTKNKQEKQNEQSESESNPSLANIVSSLQYLRDQIEVNRSCYQVIQIPKLLQSLSEIACYKIRIHFNKDIDRQSLEVRSLSRWSLIQIQGFGDEQVQSELVNIGFGRVMSLSFCTAGGIGEEQDEEIRNGLYYIYRFLSDLHEGRTYGQPSFQPLPLLVRVSLEQIEEEGANEEVEAQMKNNKGYYGLIKGWAKCVKATILNHFIHQR
ncbi:MAG: hypothetical protein EZS28_007395 [Streblomastix strix]|uniref:Uncharacterized protein n=1 Tax=Streblomastix strix TaxID=222440 RepID=A0A5J4WR95_9EUKA|nr:MAG: hypothetical protein EZS28_007395 [Streblomastix strix]